MVPRFVRVLGRISPIWCTVFALSVLTPTKVMAQGRDNLYASMTMALLSLPLASSGSDAAEPTLMQAAQVQVRDTNDLRELAKGEWMCVCRTKSYQKACEEADKYAKKYKVKMTGPDKKGYYEVWVRRP